MVRGCRAIGRCGLFGRGGAAGGGHCYIVSGRRFEEKEKTYRALSKGSADILFVVWRVGLLLEMLEAWRDVEGLSKSKSKLHPAFKCHRHIVLLSLY